MGRVIQLKRIATSDEGGTFGVLLDEGAPFSVTLEPPLVLDKDGKSTPFISSIPAGVYISRRVQSPRFGDTFEVTEVDGRTHILFHKGNATKDTKGCILVAEGYGQNGVERSRQGFDEFMYRLQGLEYFILQIMETY